MIYGLAREVDGTTNERVDVGPTSPSLVGTSPATDNGVCRLPRGTPSLGPTSAGASVSDTPLVPPGLSVVSLLPQSVGVGSLGPERGPRSSHVPGSGSGCRGDSRASSSPQRREEGDGSAGVRGW